MCTPLLETVLTRIMVWYYAVELLKYNYVSVLFMFMSVPIANVHLYSAQKRVNEIY